MIYRCCQLEADLYHLCTVTGSYVLDQIAFQFATEAAVRAFEILKMKTFQIPTQKFES